jgi:hypothetical protein
MDIIKAIENVLSLETLAFEEALEVARGDIKALSLEESQAILKQAASICYDEVLCQWLGIRYSRMNETDCAKAKLCAYYEMKGG